MSRARRSHHRGFWAAWTPSSTGTSPHFEHALSRALPRRRREARPRAQEPDSACLWGGNAIPRPPRFTGPGGKFETRSRSCAIPKTCRGGEDNRGVVRSARFSRMRPTPGIDDAKTRTGCENIPFTRIFYQAQPLPSPGPKSTRKLTSSTAKYDACWNACGSKPPLFSRTAPPHWRWMRLQNVPSPAARNGLWGDETSRRQRRQNLHTRRRYRPREACV